MSPLHPRPLAWRLLALLGAGLVITCHSEDPDGIDTARGAAQASKCEEYAAALCGKQAACVGMAGNTDACVKDAVAPGRLDCATVTAVSTNFAACLGDISMAGCPVALPATCKDVLQRAGDSGADAGPGDGGSGGALFRCDAEGSYEVCSSRTSLDCVLKSAGGLGFGPSMAEAGAKAVKYCDTDVATLINLNNIAGYSYLAVPCKVTTCSKI